MKPEPVPIGFRKCRLCKSIKPRREFIPRRGDMTKLEPRCVACRENRKLGSFTMHAIWQRVELGRTSREAANQIRAKRVAGRYTSRSTNQAERRLKALNEALKRSFRVVRQRIDALYPTAPEVVKDWLDDVTVLIGRVEHEDLQREADAGNEPPKSGTWYDVTPFVRHEFMQLIVRYPGNDCPLGVV